MPLAPGRALHGALRLAAWASPGLFVATLGAVLTGVAQAFDSQVLDALRAPGEPGRALGPPWLLAAAIALTALLSPSMLGLLALVGAVVTAVRGRGRDAVLIAAGAIGSLAIGQGLKTLILRDRPGPAYRMVEAHGPSFPSIHTLLATAILLTMAIVILRGARSRSLGAASLAGAVVLALLIGLGRVYLGVHWSSDVIAGWSAGAAWAMLCGLAILPDRSRPRG